MSGAWSDAHFGAFVETRTIRPADAAPERTWLMRFEEKVVALTMTALTPAARNFAVYDAEGTEPDAGSSSAHTFAGSATRLVASARCAATALASKRTAAENDAAVRTALTRRIVIRRPAVANPQKWGHRKLRPKPGCESADFTIT
jgi:hypothetical protein